MIIRVKCVGKAGRTGIRRSSLSLLAACSSNHGNQKPDPNQYSHYSFSYSFSETSICIAETVAMQPSVPCAIHLAHTLYAGKREFGPSLRAHSGIEACG